MAGVRGPTIEHAIRAGRIVHRPRHGARPSLDRESVLEWAAWYRNVQSDRAVRRKARERRKGSRRPQAARWAGLVEQAVTFGSPVRDREWMSAAVAALTLGCSEGSVLRWARAGHLEVRVDGQAWVSAASVARLAAERAANADGWVSHAAAAQLIGCSDASVPALVAEGLLEQRLGPRGQASISRASAEEAARVWAERREGAAVAREERRRARPTNAAPDDGQVWLTTRAAALALGMPPGGVSTRIRVGTLPGVLRGNRYWLRRVDVETAAAARVFMRRQDTVG